MKSVYKKLPITLFLMSLFFGSTPSATADPCTRLDRRLYRYHMMSNLRAERRQLQTLYPSPFGLWLAGHIDTTLLPGGRLDQLINLTISGGDTSQHLAPNANNGFAGPLEAKSGPTDTTEVQQELRKNKVVLEKLLSDLNLPITAGEISSNRPESAPGSGQE